MPNTTIVPPQEQEIYNKLVAVRASLAALKKDRTQYINSKDVLASYHSILDIVKELDKIRTSQPDDTPGNKVDAVLDDLFQVLSLFFMSVGLTKTAPATFASLTTVQRLLEHLNESQVFTKEDLRPIRERLGEISDLIESERSGHDQEEFSLLKHKLEYCQQELRELDEQIDQIDPELTGIHDTLVGIRRELLSLASRSAVDKESLEFYREQLSQIASKRDANGQFLSSSGEVIENGQNVLNGLVDDCNVLLADLVISDFKLDETLQPIYDEVTLIKSQLEDLLVTRRWTLRETDLYTYQKRLQEIDELRVNGKFPTGDNTDKDEQHLNRGQRIILYLLRRCYAIIYKLLESSEPVSESLQPLHNQLSTVRRCLLEIKRLGGVNSSRELYPFQMKLGSLDNLRTDGKFIVDGEIPEGQGTLNALLAECYDIIQEMRIEAEDRAKPAEEEEDYAQNSYHNELYNSEEDLEDEDVVDYDEEEDAPSYAPSIAESDTK